MPSAPASASPHPTSPWRPSDFYSLPLKSPKRTYPSMQPPIWISEDDVSELRSRYKSSTSFASVLIDEMSSKRSSY